MSLPIRHTVGNPRVRHLLDIYSSVYDVGHLDNQDVLRLPFLDLKRCICSLGSSSHVASCPRLSALQNLTSRFLNTISVVPLAGIDCEPNHFLPFACIAPSVSLQEGSKF